MNSFGDSDPFVPTPHEQEHAANKFRAAITLAKPLSLRGELPLTRGSWFDERLRDGRLVILGSLGMHQLYFSHSS